MKKTLTITRHSIRNYGSVLQTYATQQLLNSHGTESIVVDYRQPGVADTSASYRPSEPGFFGQAKALAYKALREREVRARGAVFEDFLKSQIPMTATQFKHPDDLLDAGAAFSTDDLYCVGSDQVWNSEYNKDNGPYYLDFAPTGARKFSLASSIGMEQLPPTEERRLVEALQTFDAISVRERQGADYLTELGLSVEQHVDPTLALTKEAWSEFASGASAPSDPYLLVYQLNANSELQRASVAIGKALGLRVIRLEYWTTFRNKNASTIMRPSVQEFVKLFENAEFVVTDSFHGVAFSTNFGKNFTAMLPPKYNNRIKSVLDLIGAEDRIATSVPAALDIAVHGNPYVSTTAYAIERERVSNYLSRVISHKN